MLWAIIGGLAVWALALFVFGLFVH